MFAPERVADLHRTRVSQFLTVPAENPKWQAICSSDSPAAYRRTSRLLLSATVSYVAVELLGRAVVTLVVAGSHQGRMQSRIASRSFRNGSAPQVELSHWGASVGEYGWFRKTQGSAEGLVDSKTA